MSHYPEKVQRYYQLLCIKADDKAYLPLTTDSLILPIVQYYTEKNNKSHLPEALFYAGRIYRDMGDAPRAISYFYRAKDAAHQDTPAELKSLINNQMGRLFYQQCMYLEAKECYQTGYYYSYMGQDTIGMVYDLIDVSAACKELSMPDSALHYLREADKLASIKQNQRLQGMISGKLAAQLTAIGKYKEAKKHIHQALNVTNERMRSTSYIIAAELYNKMGIKDTACFYYEQLMECGTLYARADAAWNLAQYAIQEQNSEKAYNFLNQYIKDIEIVWERNDTETVRKLRALYNYNIKEKENQQLKIENKQKQLHLFFALGGIFVVLLGFYNYYLYSQKEQAKLNLQLMKLKQLKDDSEKRKADNSGKNEDKELLNTKILQYIEKCIQQEAPIPTAEWEKLGTMINNLHSGFVDKLSEICKLNSFEKHVCLLLKMNIMPTHIAKLTNHSKEAVSATRRRLYKKFFGQEGTPQQWDEFINSL